MSHFTENVATPLIDAVAYKAAMCLS